MKNKLLYLLKMVSKNVLKAFLIQVIFYSVVLAENGIAQYSSIKEVYLEINLNDANLEQALTTIEKSTGFHFSYDDDVLKNDDKLSIKKRRQSLYKVLAGISKKSGLNFTRINNNIVINQRKSVLDQAGVIEIIKDDITVSGKVRGSDGESLPGVSIVIKGTTRGTTTDIDGNYRLEVDETATLVFSFVGFKSQEVQIAGRSIIEIDLEADSQQLEELVVVAYGVAKKGAFTGSATQINSEALEGRALTNITSAIEGAAGVQFSPGGGQPGESSDIRIRGFSSINNSNDPLYVVDGFVFTGTLASINPQDIESISILKDAASTALYGSRASNGVVILTTKSGKNGQSQFNVNVSRGVSTRGIKEYNRVSAQEYYPLMWEALRNSNAIPGTATDADLATANQDASDDIFDQLKTNPFNVPNDQIVGTDGNLNPAAELLYAEDLNWQSPLERTGKRTSMDMSYQGGNEKSSYFFSLSYLDDTGWAINSDFKRVSGRVNMSTQPKKWVKTGFNLAASSSSSNQSNDGTSGNSVNPFNGTRRVAPIYPVHEHDSTGAYVLDAAGNQIYDQGADRVGVMVGRHVIMENELQKDQDDIFSASGRAFVDFYFLNDFKFTLNASIDSRFFNTKDYDSNLVGDGAPLGRAGRVSSTRMSVNYNQLLSYNKDFGNHSVGILLGHESMNYETTYLAGNRNGQVAEGNIQLINFANITNLEGYSRQLKQEGYFARAEYDYDDKYFVSASFRADGSSRFDKNSRWGNFWSVGGAWRIDREAFLQGNNLFDQLKLRASYGEVGNDGGLRHDIDVGGFSYYASQALFSLGWNNDTEPGVALNQLAAPSLEWETNVQSDIALEFSALDYRLSGSVEYFSRKTEGLLFDVPLPVSSGLDAAKRNIGDMVNSGLEVGLAGDIIRTSNFAWRLDVNMSTIKNEITKLPQDSIVNGTKQYVKGGSIYDYWRRQWYGVDPADGSALYVADSKVDETDADLRTVNGTLVTTNQNDAQMAFVGTALPDLFGSFTNTFTYRNFKLGFLMTYQIGGKTYDTNYASLMSTGGYGEAKHKDILDRWQNPGDITNVPRMDISTETAADAGSSRWLISSSYLALRQINFSYDLPQKFISKAGLETVRVYVNGENLWSNTSRDGLDVNQNFSGTTQNRFTTAKIVTLGLNVTF